MNEDEKECSLIFIFLSFLRRVEVNCISQKISRKIKRPSQGQVPYPSTLYIPYLARPYISLTLDLPRLLADCRVIQHTLTLYYICYNTSSSSSPIQYLYGTPDFSMHSVKKKFSPRMTGG